MKPIRVLVTDDDHDYADGMAELIESEGYKAFVAYSGQQALETLETEEIDVIFLDVKMPDMDGIETFKAIRERKPETRIAMMTGYNDESLKESGLDSKSTDILRKPINMEDLIAAIESGGLEKLILIVNDNTDF